MSRGFTRTPSTLARALSVSGKTSAEHAYLPLPITHAAPLFATLTCSSRLGHPIAHPLPVSHCLRDDAFLVCYASRFARIVADVTAIPEVILSVVPGCNASNAGNLLSKGAAGDGSLRSCYAVYGRAYVAAELGAFVRFPAPLPPSAVDRYPLLEFPQGTNSQPDNDNYADISTWFWNELRNAVFASLPAGLRLGPPARAPPSVRVVQSETVGNSMSTTSKTPSKNSRLLDTKSLPSPPKLRKLPHVMPAQNSKLGRLLARTNLDSENGSGSISIENPVVTASDFVLIVIRIERVEETSYCEPINRTFLASKEGSWIQ